MTVFSISAGEYSGETLHSTRREGQIYRDIYKGVFVFTLILQDWNYSNLGLLFFDWLLANLKVSVLWLLPAWKILGFFENSDESETQHTSRLLSVPACVFLIGNRSKHIFSFGERTTKFRCLRWKWLAIFLSAAERRKHSNCRSTASWSH